MYGQTDSLSSYTSSTTFTSGYFGTSTFCWYKVTPNSSSIKSVNVQIITLNNADAEIYYESSTNDYTYKGSVTSGNSLRIDVGYKDPASRKLSWVVELQPQRLSESYFYFINPTTSSAYASIYVTSSSSTTAELNVDKVQEQVLIPTLIIGTVFILLFVVIIICTGPKSKGNAGVNGDQNGGPATVIQQPSVVAVPSTQSLAVPVPVPSTQPQPQMYSIPQQNANNAFQNQNQIIMNPILHASPQPVNAESQQMYILQPIRNNQPVQMGYSVAQPVALQPNMQQEYKYT